MAGALMILGTHSNAGKSLMATAFCRLLAQRGYRVAPFKAQNMSNNAGVTPEGGEIGRAQIVQAEAAGIEPHTDMNPVLLKPQADRRSQVVLNGEVHGHIDAHNWRQIKQQLWDEVRSAYDRLAARFEFIVLEGAGSPAEINLKEADIVNLAMARYANAPCLLVGDIDRGGVFAALAGTMLLLEPEERMQIKGFLINKFRGDPALLGNALADLRTKAFGVPTLGVIPFVPDLRIATEDAVALEQAGTHSVDEQINIAVVHLPHIANFDEFDPLKHQKNVNLYYVRSADQLGRPEAILLPGTKATLANLQWLRQQKLDRAILQARDRGSAVVGICGGYQIMGRTIVDPAGIEGPKGSSMEGLSLLPVETCFSRKKQTHKARLQLSDGTEVEGYEIHMGTTRRDPGCRAFGQITARRGSSVSLPDGAISTDGKVWGSYIHGLFANDSFRLAWLQSLGWKSLRNPTSPTDLNEYDRLAHTLETAIDWDQISKIAALAT